MAKTKQEINKAYRDRNKEKIILSSKLYRESNKEEISRKSKDYREKNIVKIRIKSRKYKEENSEKVKLSRKIYLKNNREKVNKSQAIYKKNRFDNDVIYRLEVNYRARTFRAFSLSLISKNKRTKELLGESYEVVKSYIETLFKSGMTWINYGKWHIDHIIPLSSANSKDELEKLCHYSNLQPLWAIENIKKGNKILKSEI